MADFTNVWKSNLAINVQLNIHTIEKVAEKKQLVIGKSQKQKSWIFL